MQFTVESKGTGSFLVYSMAEDDVADSVSMGMIDNNQIEGVIPFQRLQVDDRCYLKYNISSKVSLMQYFDGVVNRQRLISVMDSIASTVLNAAEFMLDPGAFVWDKEYIFVDVATAKAYLICVPVAAKGENGEVNLERFLRELLLGAQFDQSENCDYVARLLGFFNSKKHFGLSDFRKTLAAIGGTPVSPERKPPQYTPADGREVKPVPAEREAPDRSPVPLSGGEPAGGDYQRERKNVSGGMDVPGEKGSAGGGKDKFQAGGMPIPGRREPEADTSKGKKGISLFGFGGKSKTEKPEKAGKQEKAEKTGKKKKEDKKPTGSGFGMIRIPGRDSAPAPEDSSPSQRPEYGRPPVISETSDDEPVISPTVDEYPGLWPVEKHLFLVQHDTGKRIPVQHFPFEIGREGSGFATDASKKMVSRQHAVITKTEEGFAIRDISRHGTFLDGQRILHDVDTPLKDGMRVLLKEIEFTVAIEEG